MSDERYLTAIHEAGHATVAQALGVTVHEIGLKMEVLKGGDVRSKGRRRNAHRGGGCGRGHAAHEQRAEAVSDISSDCVTHLDIEPATVDGTDAGYKIRVQTTRKRHY